MEYRTLGTTGVQVSTLCLGTMMFGQAGNPDHDDATAIIHRALENGVNVMDTADMYSAGESEQIVGKALRGRRDNVVLATKAHHAMGDDVNQRGSSRRWLLRAVEDSLRRLQTDWIDLFQVHRPDPETRIDETLGALDDLVRSGKVRYIGSSTFPAHQIVEAQWAADRRGRERFVTEQPPYSLLNRGIEADVLPTAERYGMGVLTWSPLAGGWLSGGVAQGHRRAAEPPGHAASRPLRPADPREPGQARRRGPARPARRRQRPAAGPPRAGVRDRAPSRDQRHHRTPHDAAAGVPARRRRHPPRRGRAGPHRRDRRAGHVAGGGRRLGGA